MCLGRSFQDWLDNPDPGGEFAGMAFGAEIVQDLRCETPGLVRFYIGVNHGPALLYIVIIS